MSRVSRRRAIPGSGCWGPWRLWFVSQCRCARWRERPAAPTNMRASHRSIPCCSIRSIRSRQFTSATAADGIASVAANITSAAAEDCHWHGWYCPHACYDMHRPREGAYNVGWWRCADDCRNGDWWCDHDCRLEGWHCEHDCFVHQPCERDCRERRREPPHEVLGEAASASATAVSCTNTKNTSRITTRKCTNTTNSPAGILST